MNKDNNPIILVFLVLLVIGVYTMDILLLVDMLPKPVETDKSVVQFINLRVRDKLVRAELADTPERRMTGLMFREFMEKDSGMFFVFPAGGLHSFWMKDTKIPLDILWLDDRYRVVHIRQNVPPCDEKATPICPSYITEVKARYVLEVNAGWVERSGVKAEDQFKIL